MAVTVRYTSWKRRLAGFTCSDLAARRITKRAPKASMQLEGLDRHHRLIDSYRKLHGARRCVAIVEHCPACVTCLGSQQPDTISLMFCPDFAFWATRV